MIEKVQIKISDKCTVNIHKGFLDALALHRFNKPFEGKEIKDKTRALVRDLVGPVEKIHPLEVHYLILKATLSKSKAAKLS